MFAVVLFPVKPVNKDYPYFKSPKKVLEIEDSEALRYLFGFKGIYHLKHYLNDMDESSDKEIIDYYNEKNNSKITLSSRKSGKGYSTEDKEYFVRIIKSDRL